MNQVVVEVGYETSFGLVVEPIHIIIEVINTIPFILVVIHACHDKPMEKGAWRRRRVSGPHLIDGGSRCRQIFIVCVVFTRLPFLGRIGPGRIPDPHPIPRLYPDPEALTVVSCHEVIREEGRVDIDSSRKGLLECPRLSVFRRPA